MLFMPDRIVQATALATLAAGLSVPASALIVDDPGNARPLLTPPAAAIGTWGANASAVAIGPNHILTTRHQDGSSETPTLRQVNFNGTTYNSVSQTLFDVSGSDNFDVRLVEIEQTNGSPANLTDFLPVYTLGISESLVGQRVVMAAHGLTGINEDGAGFDWQAFGGANPNANSYGVAFGENVIDAEDTQNDNGFNGDRWLGDFDAPSANDNMTYEATVAPGDSGGALMMFRYDQWWLVGLPNAVEEASGSLPDAFFGQEWFASDVTRLASDIETAIGGGFAFPDPKPLPEPGSAALLAGLATLALRRRK